MRSPTLSVVFTLILFAGCRQPEVMQGKSAGAPGTDAGAAPSGAEIVAADLLAWSAPVNGLAARVESAAPDLSVAGYTEALFVRLHNVGTTSLRVPTSAPLKSGGADVFELYVEADGRWRRQRWRRPPESGVTLDETGNAGVRPPVTLAPGESVLCQLVGDLHDGLSKAAAIRIALNQPAGEGGDWTGRLELPPYPVRVQPTRLATGSVPCPEQLPEFSRIPFSGGNISFVESLFRRYVYSNSQLLRQLRLYQPAGVAAILGRRLAAEADEQFNIFLAAVAADAGSDAGRTALLAHLHKADFTVANSSLHGLGYLLHDGVGVWAVDAALAALTDTRQTTRLDMDGIVQRSMPISWLADEYADLSYQLVSMKCRRAVPVLIGMIKGTKGLRHPIWALGALGDPQAIPVLIDVAKANVPELEIGIAGLSPENFERAAAALGALKAKEAVPLLAEHACYYQVIEALEAIGDPAALPVLREVAAGKVKQVRGADAKSNADCVAYAKIALASLEPGDPIPRLCKLVSDMSLGEFERRAVVWRLGQRRDARVVPHLVTAAKSDPSGAVVDNAIAVLAEFRTKEAIAGLIDCFDADFAGKSNWKYAHQPEMFRENIAASLRAITGQTFGPDKRRWAEWWKSSGRKVPALP